MILDNGSEQDRASESRGHILPSCIGGLMSLPGFGGILFDNILLVKSGKTKKSASNNYWAFFSFTLTAIYVLEKRSISLSGTGISSLLQCSLSYLLA